MPIKIRLKEVLARKEMTARELARKMHLSANAVSEISQGHTRHLSLATLAALCRILDCQPGDLLAYIPDEAGRELDGTPKPATHASRDTDRRGDEDAV